MDPSDSDLSLLGRLSSWKLYHVQEVVFDM